MAKKTITARTKAIEKKKKEPIKVWSVIWRTLKYDKKNIYWMIVMICMSASTALCGAFVPLELINFTEHIQKMWIDLNGMGDIPPNPELVVGEWNAILKYLVILVCLITFNAVCDCANGVLGSTLGQLLGRTFRRRINDKLNTLPLKYYDKRQVGDTLSIIINDCQQVSESFLSSMITVCSATIYATGLIVAMFVKCWQFSLPIVGLVIIAFVGIMLVGGGIQKYLKLKSEYLGELSAVAEESYSGNLIIKSFSQEDEAQGKFDEVNKRLLHAVKMSAIFQSLFRPIMQFVAIGGIAVVCISAALLSKTADKAAYYIPLIPGYIMFVQQMNYPLAQGASAVFDVLSSCASAKRVFGILDQPDIDPQIKNAILDKKQYTVKFDKMKFGYDDKKIIIHNFNFAAKPGQKVAIVGPTGAGKTTLVNLLMKFYQPNSGAIFFDEMNSNEIDTQSLRKQFGMVLQDTWTFKGSIKDNIIFTNKNISEKKLIEVCKAANVYHLINTLPKGFDTILDESSSLSAGEKQLITIARAMISDPRMIILDEATSNVDTITEIKIQDAMDKLMKNRTSFVIAHRLSTIKNADVILVLKDGDVVESGNHKALLKKNGFYAELYNSQFNEE